ncbi:MAG: response regulator [Sulfuricella sp.]|nr:response regulator [Sulfuricella sp.]
MDNFTEPDPPVGKYLIAKAEPDGTITHANEKLVRLSGFSLDELVGRKHEALRHPDMPARAFTELWKSVRQNRPWRDLIKYRHKNGGHYWVDTFATPVRKNGETTEYMAVGSPPSYDQIREAEARHRSSAVDLAGGPRGWFARLTIKVRLTGIMALMALTIAVGGLLAVGAVKTGNDSLRAAYANHMEPAEMLLRITAMMNDNRTQVMLALQHKPDSPFLHMHDHPVSRHTGQIAANRDEIDRLWEDFRKRAPAGIGAQADRFYTARAEFVEAGLQAAMSALLAEDFNSANALLLFKVNPLYQKAYGEMDTLLGQFKQAANGEIAAAARRHDAILLFGLAGTLAAILLTVVAGVFLNRAIVRPLRGAVGHFEQISQGNLDDRIDISGHDEIGQVLAALAEMQAHLKVMLEDIRIREQTEGAMRQARDQALETSRLKSEFLSTMSHEIRTPMNGIIGMTDLLLETPLNEEQHDFTHTVRDSAHALLTIINDILDFSKIEAGKMEIEITDYAPIHLVEGSAELLAAKAREKNLSLMTFIDPALPHLMRGDPTRLRQVLVNLAGNAVKFTEHGEVHVRALADGPATVRFEVEDSGIGMSAETLAKLFQSFTQADSSTTRKYGGTGLGLAICKRLVELMGGEIGVSSEPGKGSRFWFTLPLVAADNAAPAVERPRLGSVKGLRVLVVDDHAADRKILGHYLESWGMHGTSAASADEALERMREALDAGRPYDVAMIDYAMPTANGLDLARAIRADRAFDATRMVLLTAFDQRYLANEATASGFSAYLTKPVRQSQLFDSIAPRLAEQLPPASESAAPAGAPGFHEALESGRLLLLAEDNPVNQKVAQLHLNKLGYAVHIVNNGKEAVEAAATLPYAAILMDCQMPVMDGFEATATIRKAEESGATRIPIIAMTANAMQGDRERCLAAGMDDYVSKPFTPAKLARTLSIWTGGQPPMPATLAATPAIDRERLRGMFSDDPQLIAELLDMFRASTTVLSGKLDSAVARRDAAAVKALAHEAKGAAGNVGVGVLADAAARLEDLAATENWPAAGEAMAAFAAAFRQVCRELDA